jgi:hypothetical protein
MLLSQVPLGYSAEVKFSPQAWRRAADPKSPGWSRQGLLSSFYQQYRLHGLARTKVIELLGEAAIAYELYPGSDQRERIDIYRLSAKNNESFRVEYNASDKVSSAFVDKRSCRADAFAGTEPITDRILSLEALEKALLKPYREEQILNMPISQLETLIGKSNKSWTQKSHAGGRMWVNDNYVWRLSADGRRVFTANSHVPVGNREQSDARVRSYAIVSMGPDCLPDVSDS